MSYKLMYILILAYLIIGVVALCEKKYWLFFYWIMASGLNYAVIRMGGK